nr:copper resistance protein B [Ottowia oryzae]
MNIEYKPNRLLAQQPLALEAMFCIALMPSLWPTNAAAQDGAHTHHGMPAAAALPSTPAASAITPAPPGLPKGMADMPGIDHGAMHPGHTLHATPPDVPAATPTSAPPSASASGTPSPAFARAAPAPASAMPNMDHAAMGHGNAPSRAPAPVAPAPAHAMPGMNHAASPQPMQGGRPPPDARDPDAYADGFTRGSGPYSLPGVAPLHLHDQHPFASLRVDRLERAVARHGPDATALEGELRVTRGAHQALIKFEGDAARGRLHDARTELLWGYAVAPFWDTQLGLRIDGGQGPARTWLAFGVEGTAPYNIDTRATAYLGQGGRAALRLALSYDAYLAQKLVLQPRTEWTLNSRDDAARGVGRGLSSAIAGLRLRYEITPQIAPYVGVEWQRGFGRTADLLRAGGERAGTTRWVAGVSFWF